MNRGGVLSLRFVGLSHRQQQPHLQKYFHLLRRPNPLHSVCFSAFHTTHHPNHNIRSPTSFKMAGDLEKKWNGVAVRNEFLNYFKQKGHTIGKFGGVVELEIVSCATPIESCAFCYTYDMTTKLSSSFVALVFCFRKLAHAPQLGAVAEIPALAGTALLKRKADA